MSTQTQALVTRIRDMLLNGEFAAGARLREQSLAQQLDVSRTPVRLALSELEQQGLLEYSPNRGFVAKSFTTEQILNAVDVRERLEGMAAGLVAVRGPSDATIRTLESCLLQVDGLLAKEKLAERDVETWSDVNGLFHDTLVRAAGNDVLTEAVARIDLIPLASARRYTGLSLMDRFRDGIISSQLAHRWVFEAIVERDISRAETVMRQHIHEGRNRLRQFLLENREDPRVADDARLRRVVDSSPEEIGRSRAARSSR